MLNGVLLARVRTDVSQIAFDRAVRDLVAEVENAYWDLYYSYRDLEARIAVRDIAKETLSKMPPEAYSRGKIAQAEEQLLRFQSKLSMPSMGDLWMEREPTTVVLVVRFAAQVDCELRSENCG